MIRRDFLKAVSAALASIAVPVSEYVGETSDVGFNPAYQYGNYVITSGDPSLAAKTLLENARQSLPKGTPFTLFVKESHDEEVYEDWAAVGWRYSKKLRIGDAGVFVA